VTPSSSSRVHAIFDRLSKQARSTVGSSFRPRLYIGNRAEFPESRNFAYCTDGLIIVVAPKMVKSANHRIEGVLGHELGHAILFYFGRLDHSERDADDMAERVFGKTILYDRDTVQSTEHGVCPRPSFLPQ